jgi:hypothetical protein
MLPPFRGRPPIRCARCPVPDEAKGETWDSLAKVTDEARWVSTSRASIWVQAARQGANRDAGSLGRHWAPRGTTGCQRGTHGSPGRRPTPRRGRPRPVARSGCESAATGSARNNVPKQIGDVLGCEAESRGSTRAPRRPATVASPRRCSRRSGCRTRPPRDEGEPRPRRF